MSRAGIRLGLALALSPPPATAEERSDADSLSEAESIISYDLGVYLDEDEHELSGFGTILVHNDSRGALDSLVFHLYLNAFKHSETEFFRSPFARARGGSLPKHWGEIEVHSLRITGTSDNLWERASAHSPGDPLDETSITVPLPTPLMPGDALSLDISWVSRLPDLVDRTGFKRDFHFAGQWFPKLAKLEPNGTWESFTFHPHGEFYANFGDYDVTLVVPCTYVVGATGRLQGEERHQDRCHRRYVANSVHDFAWTAWPQFEVRTVGIEGVTVHLLSPPGHGLNVKQTERALRHGLRFYGELFGAYPYEDLTVVHPPQFASAAGGMEYPTLITTGGAWYSSLLSRSVEQVTLHELGHQWFYGLLASHEQRWPFLDEGLTSYADSLALEASHGSGSGISLLGFDVSADAFYRVLGGSRANDVAVASSAAEFSDFGSLGATVYGRSASILRTWEQAFELAPGQLVAPYARAQRFQHPTPDDFLDTVRERLGALPAEQLRIALFERGWVDFGVSDVQSHPRRDATGVLPAPKKDSPDAPPFTGRAVVTRRGNLQLPVVIVLTDSNGERTTVHWDGAGHQFQVDYAGQVPLIAAVVDPDFRVLLDDNLTNNARSIAPERSSRAHGLLSLFAEALMHGIVP